MRNPFAPEPTYFAAGPLVAAVAAELKAQGIDSDNATAADVERVFLRALARMNAEFAAAGDAFTRANARELVN